MNIKIILLLVPVFLTLPFLCRAIEPADTAKDIKIKIDKESFIIIHGKTNVNRFQCRYDELSPGKTINLNLFMVDDCMMFENASLNLEIDKFDCGNKIMNKDFQDLLEADRYPSITIDIQCIDIGAGAYKTIPVKDIPKAAVVHTRFKIAGREDEYQIPVEIQEKGKKRIYTGELLINIKDFGLVPPKKMLGMVVVDENIFIQFHLVVSIVGA